MAFARRKSAEKREATPVSEESDILAAYLLDPAPDEDAAAYDAGVLARAVALARKAVLAHRKGESVISVVTDPDLVLGGRPLTAITVVNDNMPFLFDSLLGEITEAGGEPSFVTHPVLAVRHTTQGVAEILDDADRDEGVDRISVVHIHVNALTANEAARLEERLGDVLSEVRAAVGDWKPMLARLDQAISDFRNLPVPLARNAVSEAVEFLQWLRDDNFTFLGMREFRYAGGKDSGNLVRSKAPGLGILADPGVRILRRAEGETTTPEIRAFLHGPEPLIVTKANAKSRVHRRAYLDYIGVKTYNGKGVLTGELRIVGLFTSTAYTRSVMNIPYLRSKAQAVIRQSGFDPVDHSGKALINVLESYPREEFFQISVPLLRKHAMAILGLEERPRVRVLYRIDRFDRFVSVIVFVPRDRYDSIAREKIGSYLKDAFDGRVSAYYPAFPEGGFARVHFIIGRSGGRTPKVAAARIEDAVRAIVQTWDDSLREAAARSGVDAALLAIASRFPDGYRSSFTADDALQDAARIATLSTEYPIFIDFYRDRGQSPEQASLKIYHAGTPVALSRRVPLLEHMGFNVISERTFEVGEPESRIFIHDMELENAFGTAVDLFDEGRLFDEVFMAVWRQEADDDQFNALAQTAGLSVPAIRVLRAYGRYLQQAGIPQSQGFVAAVLNRYPDIARALYDLFELRLDPGTSQKSPAAEAIERKIAEGLENVPNIDDDTIIRRYLNLIEATLRTNHFVPDLREKGQSLAFKFDSRLIEGLPEPRPWREVFVYGPEVEGVHLRFGPVARGGLRWSDRAQDYRTEVLGLVKAQQVKNAVIVPVGAKGGFYPKRSTAGMSREQVLEAGRAAYVNFVSSLLSITDNIDEGGIVPPRNVLRRDTDDPYLVVAADKGTATFSDTANAISARFGFWLDDAFASGGSAGYDHKGMGITARGAWEAVKRHFREMNRDIQTMPFSAVGVGDMSGDVFGNGMMLSGQTRLIAAFDHRDIFIDPDPDPAASLAERKRLFALPRSSWQDYDKSKLSKGAMVVSRSQKSVTLTPEAAEALAMEKTTATPSGIIKAILKAPVDLLWFGGIGTYVRASAESNQEVGDRANDAIRITAAEVRAKVIGEGANLGVTQRARVEFGLRGGVCNSDAIDNSGGVNCSDVEVNIKIALAAAMRKKMLALPARNRLLADMTEEVAGLVLANNYQQTLAVSVARRTAMADFPHHARFMTGLEARGLLDRSVESLPSSEALAEREARGEPLTRAELGVLLAYAKIVLFDEVVESDVPDEPYFEQDLRAYFPVRMEKKFSVEIGSHRLRREIVTRVLVNDLVNRGGPSFVSRLRDATGYGVREIVRAFAVVRGGFGLPGLYAEIGALDNKIDGQLQLDLYVAVGRMTLESSARYLKAGRNDLPLAEQIVALRDACGVLGPSLAALLPDFSGSRLAGRSQDLQEAGVPERLAGRLALLEWISLVPDIMLVASQSGLELMPAAKAFFAVSEAFRIGRIENAADMISTSDYYEAMALARAIDTIGAARRKIAVAALHSHGKEADAVSQWLEDGGERVVRTRERLQALTESGEISVSRLSVAAGLMDDLISA